MKRTAHIVAGLAFGDEGKGSITDFLVRHHNAGMVVRYNGGSQAAHNVVTPDGRHHTFAQFGSGMFVPGVKTYLSKYMLVNPQNMVNEEEHLQQVGVADAWERTFVDEYCLIITPYQKALNRIQEYCRGDKRHSSCGQGVGQTRSDHLEYGDRVLFAKNLKDEWLVCEKKLEFIRQRCLEKVPEVHTEMPWHIRQENLVLRSDDMSRHLAAQYKKWPARIVSWMPDWKGDIVFEGAQGVLLDEHHGEEPYRTWTDTTFNNAQKILKDMGWNGETRKVGVLRSYFTRHGNGPFPTEDKTMKIPEPHNCTGVWQGDFRLGKFDANLAKKAIKIVGGIDVLALNHCDRVLGTAKISEALGFPPTILGYGPTAKDKEYTLDSRFG